MVKNRLWNLFTSKTLTEDYEELLKQYKRSVSGKYKEAKLPSVILSERDYNDPPYCFHINNEEAAKYFTLPPLAANYSKELSKAHGRSKEYNRINIRLNDFSVEGAEVTLSYSKTTHLDSLMTNCSMDYKLSNGRSIREIYEPGPFITDLKESRMANSLGFHGFVELADGKVIFICDRSRREQQWNPAISTSLTADYGLNAEQHLVVEGIRKAIREEIKSRLRICLRKDAGVENCIFAFYRDLVEGGKPRFAFYYKVKEQECVEKVDRDKYLAYEDLKDAETFEANYRRVIRNADPEEKKRCENYAFAYADLAQLRAALQNIDPHKLVLEGQEYPMKASAITAVLLLTRNC